MGLDATPSGVRQLTFEPGLEVGPGFAGKSQLIAVESPLTLHALNVVPTVKVLDFGLAKAWAGEASGVNSGSAALSQSPTLAHTGTIAGVILGTAAYMSPEQARGKPVDKRADVWSFGVLVWEMLTGRALFAGDTVTDVIAAVVTREPDLEALPKATPRAVRRLLSRCLRKDPRTRLPDIGAARLELQDVLAGTSAEPEAPAPDTGESARTARRALSRERMVWAAVALALAGLAAVLIVGRLNPAPEPRPAAHFVLDTSEDLAFPDFSPVAVSPDGRQLVFAGLSPGGPTRLWIRPFDSPEARTLPGTERAGTPFWSADSTAVAFQAEGEIRKLVLAGGTVQRVCAVPQGGFAGGTWSSGGTPSGGPRGREADFRCARGSAREGQRRDGAGRAGRRSRARDRLDGPPCRHAGLGPPRSRPLPRA